MRDRFHWTHLLAFVTGLVNQELLLRNEYLAAENRIFRARLPSRLRLSDPERCTLAEIAKRVGRKALKDVACVAKPDTILASGADCAEVRRIPEACLSRPPSRVTRTGGTRSPFCAGEPELGIRPYRGRAGQFGPSGLGPNGRQHPAPSRYRASAKTDSHHYVEGIY